MFWKSPKPKESTSTAIVRQDPRTTVKTSAAQSETTSISVQNATVYNNNKNTVEYRTTTQTTTHQQQARVTEITKRHTASKEEIEEYLREANFTKTESTTTRQTRKPTALPPIGWESINGKSPLNSPKNKSSSNNNNYNSLSPTKKYTFSYDSPRSYPTTTTTNGRSSSSSSSRPPTTPTIAKIQNTYVTEDGGRTLTSSIEQQRIKMNTKPFNLYSPQSSLPKLDAKPFNLSSPNSPLSKPLIGTTTTTSGSAGGTVYRSPYLNRSIYTPTAAPTKPISAQTASTTASINSTSTIKKPKLQPGYAYIFNNVNFDNPKNEERVGSSEDVKSLKNTFEKYKLKINLIENATLSKIESTIKKIETKDYSNSSCLVIVILSHGTRHEEVCARDGTYSIDDVMLFPILRNRTLIDKPKLFFVQACKGAMEIGAFHKDAVQPHGSPNEILKCYSTFEGYVSYRTEKGSFFIQVLCEFLTTLGEIKNIKDIMEQVTLRVKALSNNKQIPTITSTLTKPHVFGDYL